MYYFVTIQMRFHTRHLNLYNMPLKTISPYLSYSHDETHI